MSAQEKIGEQDAGFEERTLPGIVGGVIESDPGDAIQDRHDAGRAGICVLSADHEFLTTVQQTCGPDQLLVVAAEWSGLVEAIDADHCGIVLLDTDYIGDTLDRRLAELEHLATPPVIVAASSLSDAPELMAALTERRIHRLLLKPASRGNTRLLVEAAINHWLQLREHVGAPAAEGATVAAPRRHAGRSGGRRRWLLAGAMMLVFGAVVAAGFMMSSSRDDLPLAEQQRAAAPGEVSRVERQPSPAASSVARPEPVIAPPADPLAEPLERADRALAAGRLVDPPDDNALDGYAAILAVNPEHARAREGLADTIDLLFIWAESALLGEVLELAEATLDHVRRVRPESARLAFLDAQVARARAQEAPAEAAAAASAATQAEESPEMVARRQAAARRAAQRSALVASVEKLLDAGEAGQAEALMPELRKLGAGAAVLGGLDQRLSELRVAQQRAREAELLALGVERLRDGRLLAPASDSAVFYLASLRAENPDHPELAEASRALAAELAGNLRASLGVADLGGAESWLAGLERIDADPGLVASLSRELAVTRRQAEFLAVALPAAELQLLDARSLVYPDAALRAGIEGWVELEYIVDRDGRPREIAVTAAEPAGTFERAAVNAVARHRYAPFELDGVTYERLVNLRIRFELQ